MKRKCMICLQAPALAVLSLSIAGTTAAKYGQGSQSSQGGQSQPPAKQSDKSKTPDATPLTLDAPAPVNAEEDAASGVFDLRSEEHTSELQSRPHLVCRLLLEKKKPRRPHPPVTSAGNSSCA